MLEIQLLVTGSIATGIRLLKNAVVCLFNSCELGCKDIMYLKFAKQR